MSQSSSGKDPVHVFDVDLLADYVRPDCVHALASVAVKSLVDDLSGRWLLPRIEFEEPKHLCGGGSRPGATVPPGCPCGSSAVPRPAWPCFAETPARLFCGLSLARSAARASRSGVAGARARPLHPAPRM